MAYVMLLEQGWQLLMHQATHMYACRHSYMHASGMTDDMYCDLISVPVLLSYVSAMWKPIGRTKIDSFSTVETRVEARMIRIWEGDHKGALLVHQPVHGDPTCLQTSQTF